MKTNSSGRRNRIKQLAALGLLAPGAFSVLIQEALAKGDMPVINGINSLTGTVTVNGEPAKVGTPVKIGDKIATGAGSQAVVVVGRDAYMLRDNTSIVLQGVADKAGVLESILIVSGRILSVFEKRASGTVSLRAPNATIGIRGTGAYLEVYPDKMYFCLCYGVAGITGKGMDSPMIVTTTHHEQPMWISDVGDTMKAEKGPVQNHTDAELAMLEALVGRRTPFADSDVFGRYEP